MRRGWTIGAITLIGLTAGVAANAQDEKPASPPAAGAIVPAGLRAYIVVDDRFAPKVSPPKRQDDRDPRDRTKMMHDLVVEHGLNPTVAIFARQAGQDPAAKLAQALEPVVAKHKADNLGAYLVFLTLDAEFPQDSRRDEKGQFLRDLQAESLRNLATELKTPHIPFALAAAKSPQSAAWGIGENDLVVVLYNKMKVAKSWAIPAGQSPTDEQIKEIVAATEKLASGG